MSVFPSEGFGTDKLCVRRFSIESLRGVPENSGFLENDNRALGVEVKVVRALTISSADKQLLTATPVN